MAEDSSNSLPFGLADLPSGLSGSLQQNPLVIWGVPMMQAGAAMLDFGLNYKDMRDANMIGADKYFHCKANCQATRRGPYGENAAHAISDIREAYGEYVKADPASDVQADHAANRFGRASSKRSLAECDVVCS